MALEQICRWGVYRAPFLNGFFGYVTCNCIYNLVFQIYNIANLIYN